MEINKFEADFAAKVSGLAGVDDPAHDLLHFRRVVASAKILCEAERGDLAVVIPAAWLHDFVIVPKDDPRRAQASRLSAEGALNYLREIDYPEKYHAQIAHAIEAHSFSANIETKSLEAKIVQDADRLDGLGAIGIARCFATAGLLRRPFYSAQDPFCIERAPNDRAYTVDHFYAKLYKTADTLKTESGRREGIRRVEVMKKYLADLARELGSQGIEVDL